MIETLIYFFVFYIVLRVILGMFVIVQDNDDEEIKDIKQHLARQRIALVQIKMEQINGWWYGFYHSADGSEMFVAQGNTYDEAVANCRERLKDSSLIKDLKVEFKS
jgi:hypothetical protein